jgi:hypothetical protein
VGLETSLLAKELFILVPIAVWSLFWMGLGLWFSARKGDKAWFIFFLLVHLLGVPELIYLHHCGCWPFKPKEKR